MAKLNEDVLRLIFDYLQTPLEWIQVSEVCQLWKLAASKQWRKIDIIAHSNDKLANRERLRELMMSIGEVREYDNYPEITAEDAERIIKCASPFVRTLTMSIDRWTEKDSRKDQLIEFGPFSYKVLDYNFDTTLKLLAENATKIDEVKFFKPPKPELLQRLIDRNDITKFTFERCQNFYKYIPTDSIQELKVCIVDPAIEPFKGHFPFMVVLDLEVYVNLSTRPRQMLSPILPHVLELWSFSLSLRLPESAKSVSCKILMDIAKFSLMERLVLNFHTKKVTAVNSFISKLAKGCPRLRIVEFAGMQITEKQLGPLLSLPRLESLNVDTVLSFRSIVLPELLNLTGLTMTYDCANFDITNFCDALRKMPKLKYLTMCVDMWTEYLRSGSFFNYDETYRLVCQVITVVVSQNKDVIVSSEVSHAEKLKITRKNPESFDTVTSTLNLKVSVEKEQILLKDFTTFVRNNLDSYNVAVL